MALSIRNPETERLAREVSRHTGESMTEAIRKALEDRLQRLRRRRRARILRDEIDAILARLDALPSLDRRTPDQIIGYDKHGIPR